MDKQSRASGETRNAKNTKNAKDGRGIKKKAAESAETEESKKIKGTKKVREIKNAKDGRGIKKKAVESAETDESKKINGAKTVREIKNAKDGRGIKKKAAESSEISGRQEIDESASRESAESRKSASRESRLSGEGTGNSGNDGGAGRIDGGGGLGGIEGMVAGEMGRILAYMGADSRGSLSRAQLAAGLGVAPDGQYLFEFALGELEECGGVVLSKGGRCMLPERGGLVAGRFAANERGFGFVERPAPLGDIYIAPDRQRGAIDGDSVLVALLEGGGQRGGRRGRGQGRDRDEGEIVKIVQPGVRTLVGTLVARGGAEPAERRGGSGAVGRDGSSATGRGRSGAERAERRDGSSATGRDGSGAAGRVETSVYGAGGSGAAGNGRLGAAGNGGAYFAVRPDSRKITAEIAIADGQLNGAAAGHKVLAEILSRGSERDGYAMRGKIIEVIGFDGDPGVDISSIIMSHGFALQFPESAMREAASAPDAPDRRAYRGRQDLRGMKIITIDGADSKDLDDAVSIEILARAGESAEPGDGQAGIPAGSPAAGGGAAMYRLGVHIADVSHYVKPGSALDAEALSRGTSLYFADRVVPMLPQRLSNGICSLHPHVDRLAISVMMDIDGDGRVVAHSAFKSVIRTAERMTYENVRKILEGGDGQLSAEYAHILGELRAMRELALVLQRKRLRRGALDFSFKEAKIALDESGRPISVGVAEISVANQIIEEFMIACNETVAERLSRAGAPLAYRTHGKPDPDKLQAFILLAGKLGFGARGEAGRPRAGAGAVGDAVAAEGSDTVAAVGGDAPAAEGGGAGQKALQAIIAAARGSEYEKLINTLLLRSMAKAQYTAGNIGHFGLASQSYCHFTSPIRRYPDLMVHRILKDSLKRGSPPKAEAERLAGRLPQACAQCSERERAAGEAENETEDMKKAEYMQQFVGQAFDGAISGVVPFGMFVELENTVEGLVRVGEMAGDYYEFDDERLRLVGTRTGKIFCIGDAVRVKLAAANPAARQIDFLLLEPKAAKGGAREASRAGGASEAGGASGKGRAGRASGTSGKGKAGGKGKGPERDQTGGGGKKAKGKGKRRRR
ncbi:MAG: RNB domain-containing ribonuclease [Clostridiales bacterium]|nr:RNB domain-containing ribonuclease [Clostridiales bacterium]